MWQSRITIKNGNFDMWTFSSPPAKRLPVARQLSSDLTPLYLLLAAGWFAAALLPAAFGRWMALDTGSAGIALGCLCLAHALWESSRPANSALSGFDPFAKRCAMPKSRFAAFSRQAAWEGWAA